MKPTVIGHLSRYYVVVKITPLEKNLSNSEELKEFIRDTPFKHNPNKVGDLEIFCFVQTHKNWSDLSLRYMLTQTSQFTGCEYYNVGIISLKEITRQEARDNGFEQDYDDAFLIY